MDWYHMGQGLSRRVAVYRLIMLVVGGAVSDLLRPVTGSIPVLGSCVVQLPSTIGSTLAVAPYCCPLRRKG